MVIKKLLLNGLITEEVRVRFLFSFLYEFFFSENEVWCQKSRNNNLIYFPRQDLNRYGKVWHFYHRFKLNKVSLPIVSAEVAVFRSLVPTCIFYQLNILF